MKKLATHFICLILISSSAFAQVNLTNQLLLHYIFSGNSLDQSGNEVNATANGGPVFTTDRFNAANSAYLFDGEDDYLSMAATTLTATQYSYSLWAYPTANDGISALLSIGTDTENQNILLSFTDGWIGGSFLNDGNDYSARTSVLPELNKWYHIVVIRSNDEVRLYVDGSLINSSEIPSIPAAYGDAPLANIGRRANTASQYFQGKIDDIRIYGRVISEEEVVALFEETESNPSGVFGKQNLNFTMSPNPSSGDIKINLPKIGTYEVSVRNTLGEVVLSREYSNVLLISDFTLDNQVNGIYTVTIKSQDGIGTQKIVVSD